MNAIALVIFIVSLVLAIRGTRGLFFREPTSNTKEYFAYTVGGTVLALVSLIYIL